MLNKLPDLLNKNFAIGYLMPTIILLIAIYSIHKQLSINFYLFNNAFTSVTQGSVLLGTTMAAVISWIGGILLLTLNRDIIRFLEGYGAINPFRLLALVYPIEKRIYRRLKERKCELDRIRDDASHHGSKLSPKLRAERRHVATQLAFRFPDSDEFLLPTSFGNIMRSFEVYPRVMYGLDAIPVWPRLYAVVPKDYREALDDAKALVDFWVNVWLASIVLLTDCLLIAVLYHQFIRSCAIISMFLLLASYASYDRAKSSVLGWGSLVRSSFDLYLDDLRSKLGYAKPANYSRQRELWTSFSRAVYYTDPESLPPK